MSYGYLKSTQPERDEIYDINIHVLKLFTSQCFYWQFDSYAKWAVLPNPITFVIRTCLHVYELWSVCNLPYRDEQYRALWTELENLAHTYSSNSERHRMLLDFLLQTTSRCPSMQLPRKTPAVKSGKSN